MKASKVREANVLKVLLLTSYISRIPQKKTFNYNKSNQKSRITK